MKPTKTILRKKADKVEKVKVIVIPEGYTTVQDLSNDCKRCDFNRAYVDEYGVTQFKCVHPDIINAGCIDGRIVFKKIGG